MFARIRGGLSFANVVALMALFVALGGTSVAAVALKKNSVKSKHIAKNAVTSAKVKDASLKARDFGAGQLPTGAQGPQGSTGSPGAAGSNGGPGAPGRDGEPGEDGADGSPDSPSQVLGKLVQVDGEGSALDADLFDGASSAAFQRRGSATACGAGQFVREIGSTGDVTCAGDIGPNTVDGANVEDGSLGQADITQESGDVVDVTIDTQTITARSCRAFTVMTTSPDMAVNDIVFPRILLGALPDGIVMLPNVVGNAGDAGLVLCNIRQLDTLVNTTLRVALRRIR